MFTDGTFIQNVGEYPYTFSVIVKKSYIKEEQGIVTSYFAFDSNGNELCEIGSDLNKETIVAQISKYVELQHSCAAEGSNGKLLSGFENEKVYGSQVNYDDYVAVIIPMYNGENKNKLSTQTWDTSYENITELNFAVFGKAENIKVLHTNNGMTEEYTLVKEVDKVDNRYVGIINKMYCYSRRGI